MIPLIDFADSFHSWVLRIDNFIFSSITVLKIYKVIRETLYLAKCLSKKSCINSADQLP